MARQLPFDWPDRTPEMKATRNALNEMVTPHGNFGIFIDRYREEISPGNASDKTVYACTQRSGRVAFPADNIIHVIRAARSYQVLDVIGQNLGLVILEVGSYASSDPCARALAEKCSKFLATYHGRRPTDNQLKDAAYAVLKPAAAFTLGSEKVFSKN